jgi:hypothetical protein
MVLEGWMRFQKLGGEDERYKMNNVTEKKRVFAGSIL